MVAANSQVEEIETLLNKAGIVFGRPNRRGLDEQLAVVPVGLVKGLEVDVVIVVEPKELLKSRFRNKSLICSFNSCHKTGHRYSL